MTNGGSHPFAQTVGGKMEFLDEGVQCIAFFVGDGRASRYATEQSAFLDAL